MAARTDAPYFLEGKSGHALLVTRSHFPIHAVPEAVDRDQRCVTTSDLLFLKFLSQVWLGTTTRDGTKSRTLSNILDEYHWTTGRF